MDIKTPSQFGKALKGGEYAWPGGYPTFFATADGEALCFNCAKKEGRQIPSAYAEDTEGP